MKNEDLNMDLLKEHYNIEKELATKLREATKQERYHLYTALYNELFKRVPKHPQLVQKLSPELKSITIFKQMKFLKRFLNNRVTFLEVGSGDCMLSLEVSKYVKQVYAIDVSDEITKDLTYPENFQLILSDGTNIPVPQNSIDVAYSNQLMEHLHPDDALSQLQNIYRALRLGGIYICITPNRLNGPHDISKHFDTEATGFHLKEYTHTELSGLLKKVGFSNIEVFIGIKGIYSRIPLFIQIVIEKLLSGFPHTRRLLITKQVPSRFFLGNPIIGIK